MGRRIRKARKELSISQTELSRMSEVCPATVQNIEAGRANPSLSTLERILRSLGLKLKVDDSSSDWDALIDCGLPLTRRCSLRRAPTVEILVHNLRLAVRDAERQCLGSSPERKRESLEAMLLALQTSFPTIYRKHFAKSPLIDDVAPGDPDGRVIKLKRIAERILGDYL